MSEKNKIIPVEGLHFANSGEQKFSVTFKHGGVDVTFSGSPEIIIEMLYRSSEIYEHIAKTLITTVLIFADRKGIEPNDLKKHSYLQGSQIITPKGTA